MSGHLMAVAIDTGNSYVKASAIMAGSSDYLKSLRRNFRKIPSRIVERPDPDRTPPQGTTPVTYIAGDCEELIGTSWFLGEETHFQRLGQGSVRQEGHQKGKIKYTLLFLAGLLPLDEREQQRYKVKVFTNLPSSELHGAEMEEKLKGSHEFLVGSTRVYLDIQETEVYNEGVPSLYTAESKGVLPEGSEIATIMDVGGGTTNFSLTRKINGKWIEDPGARVTNSEGVFRLISQLKSPTAKTPMNEYGLEELDDYELMQAIERGDYKYQSRSHLDFSEEYLRLRRIWSRDIVQKTIHQLRTANVGMSPDIFLFTGGGANILQEFVQKANQQDKGAEFLCLHNPQYANLHGMCLKALEWLRKNMKESASAAAENAKASQSETPDIAGFIDELKETETEAEAEVNGRK